jgi:hypothetical protein
MDVAHDPRDVIGRLRALDSLCQRTVCAVLIMARGSPVQVDMFIRGRRLSARAIAHLAGWDDP